MAVTKIRLDVMCRPDKQEPSFGQIGNQYQDKSFRNSFISVICNERSPTGVAAGRP